jgi:hypothetical protein
MVRRDSAAEGDAAEDERDLEVSRAAVEEGMGVGRGRSEGCSLLRLAEEIEVGAEA